MYLRHFALTRLPFETPAHTDELFESNARREAEARLHHLIELKGIGLITGEVGSGTLRARPPPTTATVANGMLHHNHRRAHRGIGARVRAEHLRR